jgi:hypothetical protein
MERARHASERGMVLRALYSDFGSRMTGISTLYKALDLLGYSMDIQGLEFHLALLSDLEYVKITRAEDLPGWRSDRPNSGRARAIVFARLMPRGLNLIDGNIPSDPNVSFGL